MIQIHSVRKTITSVGTYYNAFYNDQAGGLHWFSVSKDAYDDMLTICPHTTKVEVAVISDNGGYINGPQVTTNKFTKR